MIIVSACLLGKNCTYKGGNNFTPQVVAFLEGKDYLACCPEQLGGLSTPRPPAEVKSSSVLDCNGKDVTAAFTEGAQKTLALAQQHKAEFCILKENSPSCGSCFIHNGNFDGGIIAGSGITAALLRQNGFAVFSELDLPDGPKNPV